jgi:PilZ domain
LRLAVETFAWESAMPERRTKPRQRILKAAKIIFNNRRSVFDCTARDLTAEGACLIVGGAAGLPNTFELQVPVDNLRRHCRVAWKRAGRIGVKFVEKS